MRSQRIEVLDSLRGIATLQVVIGHCFVGVPALGWLVYLVNEAPVHDFKFYVAYSPLHFFWSATPAVYLFFVLSGYVLSIPFYSDKNNDPPFVKFFIKRIFRLYLPCLIIISFSFLLKNILYKENALTMFDTWIREIWSKKLTNVEVLKSFLLYGDYSFNGALWTLPIEIKLSILLVLFNKFYKRINLVFSLLTILVYPVLFHLLSNSAIYHTVPDLYNFYYFMFFIVGAFLCKYRVPILEWINRKSLLYFCLFLVFIVSIYTFQYTFWWLPSRLLTWLNRYENFMYCISGFGFIIITLSNRMMSLFNNNFFLFFGKISFSLYLIHEVVMIATLYLFYNVLNMYFTVFIGFVLSILLAIPFYKYIEKPTSNIAKKLSDYVYSISTKGKTEISE